MFKSVEQVRNAIGDTIGPGEWFTVDQLSIDRFAEATGDDQWIHVDPQPAADGPYGTAVAHGYLTLALIPVLVARLYTLDFGTARINYGADRVRFPAAVPSGSRIRATAIFPDLRDSEPGAQLTVGWVVQREGGGMPACVAETITMVAS